MLLHQGTFCGTCPLSCAYGSSVSVSVSVLLLQTTLIIVLYARPSTPAATISAALSRALELRTSAKRFIVVGDFNIYFPKETNSRAELLRFFPQYNLHLALPFNCPTAKGQATIDFIFSSFEPLAAGTYVTTTASYQNLSIFVSRRHILSEYRTS